ncbi:hypothetical protein BD779DRAFT_1474037 [Infundibulicybe gibba]|nr:hypothetical protein BD779DRAFT_1474037 [Infundibulicybe gibba]
MVLAPLPRRVIVDDADPRIQYSDSGQWTPTMGVSSPGTQGIDTNGPPFQNTARFTNITSGTSSLSFRFQGSSPQVSGTSLGIAYECFIDGTSIGSTPGSQAVAGGSIIQDNALLCDGIQFSEEGEYTLTLNVSSTVGDTTVLWFDYITYIPSTSVQLGSDTILVDRLDSAIAYNMGSWVTASSLYNLARFTQVNNSGLTFNFTGTSVSWVGYTPMSNQSTSAMYSIDSGEPEIFRLNASPHNLSDQVLFTSPNLNPGLHSLEVVYQGDNDTPPLALNYLVVANNRLTPSQTPSVPPTIATSSNKLNGSTPVGAIIGGVIGGIAVLCLAAFLLWRRNRQQRSGGRGELAVDRDHAEAPAYIMQFNAMPSGPTMTEGGSRISKVHHTQMEVRGLNRQIFLPHASSTETYRDMRNTVDEAVDPPPSYVS